MAEKKEDIPEMITLISQTMNENYRSKIAEETQKEIVELINDVIDALGDIVKRKDFSESAFSASLFHVIMPLSYNVYITFL